MIYQFSSFKLEAHDLKLFKRYFLKQTQITNGDIFHIWGEGHYLAYENKWPSGFLQLNKDLQINNKEPFRDLDYQCNKSWNNAITREFSLHSLLYNLRSNLTNVLKWTNNKSLEFYSSCRETTINPTHFASKVLKKAFYIRYA